MQPPLSQQVTCQITRLYDVLLESGIIPLPTQHHASFTARRKWTPRTAKDGTVKLSRLVKFHQIRCRG